MQIQMTRTHFCKEAALQQAMKSFTKDGKDGKDDVCTAWITHCNQLLVWG